MPSLKKVILPKVKKIGNNCFRSNANLTTVTLPALTTTGNDCFRSNANLTTVTLPALTTTGNFCFSSNDNLTTVTLPALTTTGNFCFYSNDNLTTVTLPALTTTGNHCFSSNDNLTTVFLRKIKYSVKNVDGYCFIIKSQKTARGILIYTGGNFVEMKSKELITDPCYVAEKNKFFAHGKTVKKAIGDLNFKIVANKLKKAPIKKDSLFDVKYYRLLTGACDMGCRDFMTRNGLPFIIEDEETVYCDENKKPTKIKAIDLLPILQKNNAFGFEKFKQLVTF
jgi:hypothetical protein